jgi:hypothetical protein
MSNPPTKDASLTKRKAAPPRRTKKRKLSRATGKRRKRGAKQVQTKKAICLALLSRSDGASIADIQDATGWQAHSVRGFLAATVKKMPDMTLDSVKSETGPRRYRVRTRDGLDGQR